MERKTFIAGMLAALATPAFSQAGKTGPGNGKPFVVKAGRSRTGEPMFYKGKHPNDIIVSKKDTNNNLSIFLFTGYDKVGPSTHLHFDQDEIFYVLEGKYRFAAGAEMMELDAGDTIFLPRNIPHSWLQLSNHGKLLYAVQPSGTLEEFFTEMNGLIKPPTHEESQALHLKHGMKLVGPGLKL